MKTGARKVRPAAFCLLILAGTYFGIAPALAQEACPPPPGGAASISDPNPRAENVTSSNLRQFVLSARTAFKEAVAAGRGAGLHFGCLVRQEGGGWRSGSTYLVQLAPNGRVFLHAKNMALSGRLLKPGILAQILIGLGVPQTSLTNPNAVLARLGQEPETSTLSLRARASPAMPPPT